MTLAMRLDTPLDLSPRFAMSFVLKVLEKANVTKADQMVLLGVSGDTLERCRRGETLLLDRDVLTRLEDFLHCYTVLKALYAREYELIYAWLRNSNTVLVPNPIEYMKRFGINTVRAYLEGALHR